MAETHHIGEYEIIELIDKGAQGSIYRARYTGAPRPGLETDQIVALKRMVEEDQYFDRQADFDTELAHPNIVSYLQTFYQAKTPIGNMNALRQTRPEAQMANKQLNDFQSLVKQSPSAYLEPSPTPDFAAPGFTRETRNLLSEISSLAERANFENATKLFEAQLSGTQLAPAEKEKGHALLQSVYDSFDALSLHRINHPLSAQTETQWLSLETCEAYRAHFLAVKNFVTWNRSAITNALAP